MRLARKVGTTLSTVPWANPAATFLPLSATSCRAAQKCGGDFCFISFDKAELGVVSKLSDSVCLLERSLGGHQWSRPGGRLRSREESRLLTIPRLSCCSFNSFFVGDQANFKIVTLLKGLNKEHSKLPVLPLITNMQCFLYALICNCCGLGKNCRLNHTEEKMRTWNKNYSPWLSSFNLLSSRFSTLRCKALVQLKKKTPYCCLLSCILFTK